MLAAFLALALSAQAQAPAPAPPQQQQPAPATAPAASTGTAAAPPAVVAPAPAPTPAPPPKPVNPIQVRVHRDAADWEPVSVAVAGDPSTIGIYFSRRLRKRLVKPKPAPAPAEGQQVAPTDDKPVVTYRGELSKGTAAARVHPHKEDKLLVISVYPKSLRALRKHVEARFLIVEGYLEEAKVAEVTVAPGSGLDLEKEDAYTLEHKGVDFTEDFPSSAKAYLAAISLKRGGLNVGVVNFAAFADRELELTSFSWKAKVR